jgi:hypothetical protein
MSEEARRRLSVKSDAAGLLGPSVLLPYLPVPTIWTGTQFGGVLLVPGPHLVIAQERAPFKKWPNIAPPFKGRLRASSPFLYSVIWGRTRKEWARSFRPYDRGRLRPGQPFPGNLSGVGVRRHNSAVCPFPGCLRPKHSIYRPGDALSGERHRQSLARRSYHGISRLRRPDLDRRRHTCAIAQPPALNHRYLFPRLNCITMSRIWRTISGPRDERQRGYSPVPPFVVLSKHPRAASLLKYLEKALDGPPRRGKVGMLGTTENNHDAQSASLRLLCRENEDEEGLSPRRPLVCRLRGLKQKGLKPGLPLTLSSLRPWQTVGPRRFAGQGRTSHSVGFDSRVVHPNYTRLSSGALR